MDDAEYGSLDNEDDRTELVSGVRCKIEILQQIDHRGEVNRARYMPQNPFMIATKTCSSEVHIFDYRNHPSKPPIGGVVCNPDFRLRGHSSDGFGLEWSKFKPGTLLSGSDDGKICLWDINATPKNKSLHAMQIFQAHKGHVEDVAWHCSNDQVYGSCGSDRYLHIFDLRCPWYSLPIQSGRAHQSTINSLAFSPYNDWLVATGSADKTLKLFDTRKYISPIHTFSHHNDEVVQVGWSPHSENILASCSADRRLMVWDRSRIGQKQTPEDADDGPPELLFIHGGHTSKITEFSWNPCEEWIVASVADDNMLQVWQMAEHIYDG